MPINLPQEGVIFAADAGPEFGLLRRRGNTVEQFDPRSILTQEERQQLGNVGSQLQTALGRLGVDFGKLPKFNISDVLSGVGTKEFVSRGPEEFGFSIPKAPVPISEQPGTAIRTPLTGETPEQYQASVQQELQKRALSGLNFQPTAQIQAPAQITTQTPQVQTVQQGIQEAQRLATLAQQQKASDIAAGRAQTFQPGTATPVEGPQTQNLAPGSVVSPSTSQITPQSPTATSFNDIFNQFGLSTQNKIEDVVKTISTLYGFKDINSELEKLDNKKADDVTAVNDNPWLSEGLRSRKVANLQEKYEQKKEALINRLKFQGDIVGQALKLYDQEREFQKDLVFKAIDLRQKELGAEEKLLGVEEAGRLGLPFGITRKEAAKRGIVPRFGRATEEIGFSSSQVSRGAAVARIPIKDFQELDQDTQNFFINNSSQIKAKQKIIDEAKMKKEDPASIEKEISESGLPDAVKDSLTRYLKKTFPEVEKSSLPWWRRLF